MVHLADVLEWTTDEEAAEWHLHRKPGSLSSEHGGPCLVREKDLVRWYLPLLADARLLGGGWFQILDSGFSRFDGVWLRDKELGPPLVLEAKGILAPRDILGEKGSVRSKLEHELKYWRTAREGLSRAASWYSGGRRPGRAPKPNSPHAVAERELQGWVQERLDCQWNQLGFGASQVLIACTGLSKSTLRAIESLAANPSRGVHSITLLVFRIRASELATKQPAGDARVYRRRFEVGERAG